VSTLPQLAAFQVPNFNLGDTFTTMARLSAYDAQRRSSELDQEEKRGKLDRERLWRSTIAKAFPTVDPRAPAGLTAAQPQAQAQMPAQAAPMGGLAGPQAISQGPSTMGPQGMASQVPVNQWMDVNPQTGEWSTPGGLSAPPTSPMAPGGLTQPQGGMPPEMTAMAKPEAPGQPPLQGGGLTLAQAQSAPTGPPGASTGTLGAPQPTRPLEALVPGLMPMPDMRVVQEAFAIDPAETSRWYGAHLTQRAKQLEEVTRNNELVHQVTGAMLDNPAYYKEGLEYLESQGVPVPKNMPREYNPALVKFHHDISGKRLDPLQEAHRQAYLADAEYKRQQGLTEGKTREAVERFRAGEGGQPAPAQAGGREGTTGGTGSPMDTSSLPATFRTKAAEVEQRLGMQQGDLLRLIHFETGGTFDPAVKNRAGSGATGLIQFMPETAKALGTTSEALAKMTPDQQLDYVEKYLSQYKGKIGTLQDAYMAVLYPKAIGQSGTYKLFTKEGDPTAYRQNAGLDTEGKGYVTVADATNAVQRTTSAAGEGRAGATTPAANPRIAELRQQIALKQRRANEAANIGTPLAGAATQLRSEITDLQQELARLEEPGRELAKQQVLQPGKIEEAQAAAKITLEAKMNEPIGAENAIKMNLPPQTKWKDVPKDVRVLDRPGEGVAKELGTFKASHEGITRVLGMLDQPGAKSIIGTLLSSEDNAAFRRAAGEWISSVTPAERKFAAALVAEIAGIRNTISGQAVSAQESEFLKPMLPSVADPDIATVRAKLEVLQEWIARKHEGARGQLEEMGFRTPKALVTGSASAAGTPPPVSNVDKFKAIKP
jgi:Transglycosylase SLT domain